MKSQLANAALDGGACCSMLLALIIGLAVGLTRKVASSSPPLHVVTAMIKLPVTCVRFSTPPPLAPFSFLPSIHTNSLTPPSP